MQNTQAKSYTGPFIVMVILFFFVGFFTNINQQFQEPIKEALLSQAGSIKNTLMTLITFSWFLAYPIFGGTGAKWVSKSGYKGTLVKALLLMVGGLAIFEASVLLQVYSPVYLPFGSVSIPLAFFIFLIGSFVVGGAVTIMQVVINPFLTNCQVKGTSDVQRQNIGGTSNSIATTIGPLFVAYLIFGGQTATINQLAIPFGALMLMIILLSFIVSKLNLPTIESATTKAGEKLDRSIWSFRHLALGVAAIFFYVGVEVAVGTNVVSFAKELGDNFAANAAKIASMYWGGMLVGRFIGSFLSKVPAKTQLTVTSAGAIVLLILSMILKNPWLLVGVGLCHSVMWPAIFSLAVLKLGKYTSLGSAALMAGVLGGGIIPLIQGVLADSLGSWELTWVLVIVSELFLLYYAVKGCKPRQQDIMTNE
ncbi:MAG: MFS transporter [Rikenellaceae bacterium]|nr:MFS transporter [Rikenellaceae bacterium]